MSFDIRMVKQLGCMDILRTDSCLFDTCYSDVSRFNPEEAMAHIFQFSAIRSV